MPEMTLEGVLEHAEKRMLPTITTAITSSEERQAAAISALNTLISGLRTQLDEQIKARGDVELALTEFQKRLARNETLSRDYGVHVDRNGLIRQNCSPELARHISDLARGALRHAPVSETGERLINSTTDSEGGYLVNPEFSTELIRLIAQVGVYRRLARVITMKTNELNIGEVAAGVTVYWVGENVAITASQPTYGRVTLTAKILGGLIKAPESWLEDASPEQSQLLVDLFVEAIAAEEDAVGFRGDVSGLGSAFNGILFASGTVPKVMDAGDISFTNVNPDYLLDMQTTVPDGARTGAIYIMSPTVFDYVRKTKDNNGNYIFQPPTQGQPGTIWGRGYELSEQMPQMSDTAANTPFIAYGNVKYLLLGDRKRITVRSSDVAGDAMEKVQVWTRVHERIAIASYAKAFSLLKTAAA